MAFPMEKIQVPRSDSDMHTNANNNSVANCHKPMEMHQRPEIFQDMNHGDNEVNAGINSKQINQQRPKQTEAEEGSHVAYSGGRALQFTPEMIRDQELLVTSMSQQFMPEAVIRRQFERLLEEQSKQLLAPSGDSKRSLDSASANQRRRHQITAEKTPREGNNIKSFPAEACNAQLNFRPVYPHQQPQQQLYQNYNHQQQQHQTQQQQQSNQPQQNQQNQQVQQQNQCQNHCQQPPQCQNQCQQQQQYQNLFQQPHQQQQQQPQIVQEKTPEPSSNSLPPRVEPVSLLKLRMEKVAQSRNNGLQDFDTAHEIIKSLKIKSTLREHECSVKLDGIHDKQDIEPMLRQMHTPPGDEQERKNKQILANGLERDPNQPVPVRRSIFRRTSTDDMAVVYPRQKEQNRTYPEWHHSNQGNQNQQHQEAYQQPPQCHASHMQNAPTTGSPVNTQQHQYQHQHQHQQQQQQQQQQIQQQQQVQEQQQANQNCWSYCPDLHEPRVIGGVTYLARKPHCMPANVSGFSSDGYGNIDHSKSNTAF